MATQIRLPQTSFGTGFKNKFTNPKFDFWNRLPLLVDPDIAPGDDFFTINTGALATISQFTADKWVVSLASPNTAPTVLSNQVVNAAANPNGFPNSLKITMTVVEPSTNDTYCIIAQNLEASEASNFELGKPTSTASLSLSFRVKTSIAGTYHICYRNGYYDASITGSPPISNTRTHIIPFVVNNPNVWEYKEIIIPTDTENPTNWLWHTEDGVGLEVFWVLYAGTNFETTNPNQWNNENKLATSTQSGFETVLGATFEITGCQLELGPHVTPFEHRPVSVESDMCSNYYQRGFFVESTFGTFTGSTRTNEKFVQFKPFPFNRTPTFKTWIRYGSSTGIAPVGSPPVGSPPVGSPPVGSPPISSQIDWVLITTPLEHSYPIPQVLNIYPYGINVNFERHTVSGNCSLALYYEVEWEPLVNE